MKKKKSNNWFFVIFIIYILVGLVTEDSSAFSFLLSLVFIMIFVAVVVASIRKRRQDESVISPAGRVSQRALSPERQEGIRPPAESEESPAGPVMLTPEGNLPEPLEELAKRAIGSFLGEKISAAGPVVRPAFMPSLPSLRTGIGELFRPVSRPRLQKRQKYLQVALNSTLAEAQEIISRLPASGRILIEAGTPLIKIYGTEAVSRIKDMAPAGTYIVADNKCADLAGREVEMMARAGANAATCLGVAPVETIDAFIEACRQFGIDSMVDMMNVESALAVLKKLKTPPDVVMLHRGVDESEFSKEKQIPFYQIQQIKGNYKTLVSVAGGDTIREVQRAVFNGADIVVVWKNFYQPSAETVKLGMDFLKEIK